MLNKIAPSVYFERTVEDGRSSENPEFVEKVSEIQVRRSVEAIIERSLVLRQMIEAGEIGLVGAMYDIATGAVRFLDDTLMIGEVRHQYVDLPGRTRV